MCAGGDIAVSAISPHLEIRVKFAASILELKRVILDLFFPSCKSLSFHDAFRHNDQTFLPPLDSAVALCSRLVGTSLNARTLQVTGRQIIPPDRRCVPMTSFHPTLTVVSDACSKST